MEVEGSGGGRRGWRRSEGLEVADVEVVEGSGGSTTARSSVGGKEALEGLGGLGHDANHGNS